MTKELIELLNKMRESLLKGRYGIKLNKQELRLIIKYINDLEIEIAGDYDFED